MSTLTDENTGLDQQSFSLDAHSRSSVRYIRKDLKTYLTNHSFFNFTPIKTELLDISSGGVQVTSSHKLRLNRKLSVNICFLDGYKFEINGKIVRVKVKNLYLYKLSFESFNRYVDSQNSTFNRVYMSIAGTRVKTKYRNITTNSIQVLAFNEINKKEKITLIFEFLNGDTIEKEAKVTHLKVISKYQYGIKFDRKNQSLGNYLLKTQKSLVFAQ